MEVKAISCPSCSGSIPADHPQRMNCIFCGTLLIFNETLIDQVEFHVPKPGNFPSDVGRPFLPSVDLLVWWTHYWLWKKEMGEAYQELELKATALREAVRDERLFGSCENSRHEILRLKHAFSRMLISSTSSELRTFTLTRLPTTPPTDWEED